MAKAEKAVKGQTPVKRNRFVTLTGARKSVNRALEAIQADGTYSEISERWFGEDVSQP